MILLSLFYKNPLQIFVNYDKIEITISFELYVPQKGHFLGQRETGEYMLRLEKAAHLF